MNRHWSIYIHQFETAARMAQSDANITRTEKNVLRSWDIENNMPRYRVGLMPDSDETVSDTFLPE